MLDFSKLHVNDSIKSVLMKYEVDFVFQPIFSYDGEIIGREALMRPKGKGIMDFIEEMKAEDKLHELELLTFFGAALAYRERGYSCYLSVNSFRSECLSEEEAMEFYRCLKPEKDKMIVEILEYTEEKHWTWDTKKHQIDRYDNIEVALDDFGSGYNDMNAVRYYNPDMIKVDISLISQIDSDPKKQEKVKTIVKKMHQKAVLVTAEGVERKEELAYLKSIGVDYFQGYYLGMPA